MPEASAAKTTSQGALVVVGIKMLAEGDGCSAPHSGTTPSGQSCKA